ncbi:hypothetical protein C8035_v010962 [Colletotrichum spinosum]|uniref:Uncharacterized protein n=1 Tax=Colletotrichum spinosum TaxID=1347390 RepID=A0A4R8QI96_9PEZI|nr:hypothetical protein C8035_v010962 [Colletotrichum spinosum]
MRPNIFLIAVSASLTTATSLYPSVPLGTGAPSTLVPVATSRPASSPSSSVPGSPDQSTSSSALTTVTVTSKIPTTRTIHLIPKPSKTNSYNYCGGLVLPTPKACTTGQICINDPWGPSCGTACDAPGICIEPVQCGGFIGAACPDGKWCIDDPRDDCDPKNGGADCIGLCV